MFDQHDFTRQERAHLQTLGISGWMEPRELLWLYRQAKRMHSIVEIGSWKGRSTYALLTGCPGTVHAVDHFQGSVDERDKSHQEAKLGDIYSIFMQNVGHFKNLAVHRLESTAAAARFTEVDMVFIDGGHAFVEVCADIEAWSPVATKLICGHDYHFPSVLLAVHRYFETVDNPVDDIWVGIQRRAPSAIRPIRIHDTRI